MASKPPGSPYLPVLTADSRVEAANARQDRLVVEIGDWYILGARESIDRFYDAIGHVDPSAPRPRLFAIAGRQNTQWPEIMLRQSQQMADTRYGKPLLAGRIATAIHYDPNAPGRGQPGRRLYFQGTINPTRFVAHQPKRFEGRTIVDPVNGPLPNVRMFAPASLPDRGDERPLADVDNVILSQRALSYARPEAWHRHLLRYFDAVPAELDAELRDAALDANIQIQRSNRFQLRTVETYWEFYSEDAPAIVRDIAPFITAMGKNWSERPFVNTRASVTVEQNQFSVRSDLSGQRTIKVYAKTPTRIRFEVEHGDTFFRHLPGRPSHIQRMPGQWLPLLDQLATLAADAVNEALQRIGERVSANRRHRTPYELLAYLIEVLGDADKARAFASLLVSNGRVTVGKGLVPRDQALTLVRRGVLESVRSARGVYALAPDYASALAHLKAFRAPNAPRVRRRRLRAS